MKLCFDVFDAYGTCRDMLYVHLTSFATLRLGETIPAAATSTSNISGAATSMYIFAWGKPTRFALYGSQCYLLAGSD